MLTRRRDGVVPNKPTPAAPDTESCRPPSTVPLVKSENKPMREVGDRGTVQNVESVHFERRRSRRGAATSTESRTSAGLQRSTACEERRVPAKVTASGAGGVTGSSSGVGPESSEVDFHQLSFQGPRDWIGHHLSEQESLQRLQVLAERSLCCP
ncbi:hypothetical protein NDU88_011085 [Pleurodeles waltl]|uniref:Uncharacterized protein n=1 Tax=Pleurodeles waltl TaxID=8319 RepID=A0AAV7S3Q8_PLEWA|nr:hypothetical protein NDU88_011085 [Pleurodeles waltl]